ncbi:acyltransferase family protein [Asticcacaulis sp. 201]|uniref:acyltransferase family protein n=1 Tax=Asticcacaulis sp. 201 TaxID=3028787 RepID=UPI002916395A|nr:heparan-alpha-glucosaminide N-acetyltransferase domain-containing protein [Asticcacaulis sp. 201]MDV6330706.1 heparan-alpha-glucosaminide N-acetyltransferase domain-containing protein [Asticcacaulis sp. 201]
MITEAATPPARPVRLISLDVLRGLAVIGMILANATDGVKEGFHAQVFSQLLHERWEGLHLADTVFPAFLMMVGVSVPLALGKIKASGAVDAGVLSKVIWRAIRLVALGFILVNIDYFANFATNTWRLFGVLQRTGLVYGACGLLFLTCGPKTRLGIAAGLLIFYWPLALLPQLDAGPSDIWVRGHNFIGSVDRVWLGDGHHNYVKGPEGYDPEGLLGTLPAIAHGLIGVAVGEFISRNRGPSAAGRLAIAGLVMLLVGIGWGFVFPVIKDIWSSSFVLVTCGLTTLVLASLHFVLDRGKAPHWAALFPMAFGINAIVAYVLDELWYQLPTWSLFGLPYFGLRGWIYEPIAALIPVILFILFIWMCVEYLRRQNWIVKI